MKSSLTWLQALRDPAQASAWTGAEAQRVVRLARRLRLLARLAESLLPAGVALPQPVLQHLQGERQLSRYRLRLLGWAAESAGRALHGADYPRVLLKGAAYVAQQLPMAAGRLPSDLDLLVPRAALADAQQRLKAQGWQEVELDEHDQLYYAEWSHEVPPMRHPQHGIEIDLHHSILPPVARTTVDASLLLARVQPSGWPGWQALCPVDQVLHSAAHLFHDSELRDRLRDLVDLNALLRHFAQRPGFWDELVERAQQLGLQQSLALAVHYTSTWLGTPVPPAARRACERMGPGPVHRAWLLPLLDAVLTPTEPDDLPSWQQDAAATALLARHHWQRMPLRLLLPHLWHKSRSRRQRQDDGDDGF